MPLVDSRNITPNAYEERRRSYYASPRKDSRRREHREREDEPTGKPWSSAGQERRREERREAHRARDEEGEERDRARVGEGEERDRARVGEGEERREAHRARVEEREERRRARAAQHPEREALRQERRHHRRASRQASTAQEPSHHELQPKDRRQQRRAARRAQRRAPKQEQREAGSYAAAGDDSNEGVVSLNDVDHSTPLDPITLPRETGIDPRPTYRNDRNDRNDKRRLADLQPRRLPRGESWLSSEHDWTVDLEHWPHDEKKHNHSKSSVFSELAYYKRHTIPEPESHYRDDRRGCCAFSRTCTVLSLMIVSVIVLIIIITVAAVVSKQNKFDYKPSTLRVNNTYAFSSGGATRDNVNSTNDGIGAGTDAYTYYKGNFTHFPESSKWVSFEDMWNDNLDSVQQACGWLNYGQDDSAEEIQDIYNAIQNRANASLVDHRLILAFILQESHGCVRIPHTTSSGGTKNTGLMQAHDGHEYNPKHQDKSILQMVQDGTQGTKTGNGIVQELNAYGNPYSAARAYNSGYIDRSGDLSAAAGATACYVSDIANRLTGWVKATSSCPG